MQPTMSAIACAMSRLIGLDATHLKALSSTEFYIPVANSFVRKGVIGGFFFAARNRISFLEPALRLFFEHLDVVATKLRIMKDILAMITDDCSRESSTMRLYVYVSGLSHTSLG